MRNLTGATPSHKKPEFSPAAILSILPLSRFLLIPGTKMKKVFASVLILGFASLITVSAGMRFDAKTWSGVHTYNVPTLARSMDSRVGQLLAINFNFRGRDIHHLKPAWFEGSIWQPDPNGHKGFSNVRVMVSEKDLNAFKSIPTDSTSVAETTVYGRVLHDADANFLFIRLVGRNTIVDPSGTTTVTW